MELTHEEGGTACVRHLAQEIQDKGPTTYWEHERKLIKPKTKSAKKANN